MVVEKFTDAKVRLIEGDYKNIKVKVGKHKNVKTYFIININD